MWSKLDLSRSAGLVALAVLLAGGAGPAYGRLAPDNGDFDSGGINLLTGAGTNLKAGKAGDGWYTWTGKTPYWDIGDIDSDGDDEGYWQSDGTGQGNNSDTGIAEVILNNSVDTGDFTLEFDWQSTAANVNLYYSLSGESGGNVVNVGSTSTVHGMELVENGQSDGILVIGDDFASGSGTVSVDFTIPAGGFAYYGLRFIKTDANAQAGEYFAIDNVQIIPAGQVLLGDVDLNTVVDTADIDDFVQVLQGTLTDPDAVVAADVDENTIVDTADIAPFIAILQGPGPDAGDVSEIPEPASLMLLGAGGLVVLLRRQM